MNNGVSQRLAGRSSAKFLAGSKSLRSCVIINGLRAPFPPCPLLGMDSDLTAACSLTVSLALVPR